MLNWLFTGLVVLITLAISVGYGFSISSSRGESGQPIKWIGLSVAVWVAGWTVLFIVWAAFVGLDTALYVDYPLVRNLEIDAIGGPAIAGAIAAGLLHRMFKKADQSQTDGTEEPG